MNIQEIAKIAGVSISTVSRSLNDSPLISDGTKARVQKIAKEHNYIPNALANGLLKNRTHSVGILTTDVRIPHYGNIVHTLESQLNEAGYHVFLCNTGGDFAKKKAYLSVLLQNRVDGIVLVGSVYHEDQGDEHLTATARSVPIVLINNRIDAPNIYSVATDYAAGIFLSVEYAIKKGRSKLLFVAHQATLSKKQKYAGFRRAIETFPELENSYQFFYPPVVPTHDPLENAAEMDRRLLEVHESFPFDAVISDDDTEAIVIMNRLQHLGLAVPQRVGVIGFNNSYLAQYSNPNLTSVDVSERRLGERAAETLLGVLADEFGSPTLTVLPPRIVERDSL